MVLLCGAGCLFVQLWVSIREREANRVFAGDPWDGRALEWSTSAPPPEYNFAHIPHVERLDAFYHDKRSNAPYAAPPHTATSKCLGTAWSRQCSGCWGGDRLCARLVHVVAGDPRRVCDRGDSDRAQLRSRHAPDHPGRRGGAHRAAVARRRSGEPSPIPREVERDIGQSGPGGDARMSAERAGHAGLNLGDTDAAANEAASSAVFGFWVFLMSDAVIFALLFATYGVMLPGDCRRANAGRRIQDRARVHRNAGAADEQSIWHGIDRDQARGAARAGAGLDGRDARRSGCCFSGSSCTILPTWSPMGRFRRGAGICPRFSAWCHSMVSMCLPAPLDPRDDGAVAGLRVDARVKINILRLGLFWHFLDIVWIAIFSTVYFRG